MFEQGQDAAGDQVDRGRMTGHQEQDGRGQQLPLGQLVTLLLGQGQLAQEVRTGVGTPLGQEGEEVLGEARIASVRARRTSLVRRKSGSSPG